MRPVAALVGLTIKTPRLEAMTDFYASAFGLEIISRTDHEVALKGGLGSRPHLILRRSDVRGLGGLTFSMRSAEDVDASASDLRALGFSLIIDPIALRDEYGFAINDPDGVTLRFRSTTEKQRSVAPAEDGPAFLSHVVLNSRDATRLRDFYIRVLGFTKSDEYEKGLLTFLRCDQPQHHCVGISPGPVDGLNHFAMDCGNIDSVMRGISRMASAGHQPIWGPGRHGPGGNIFCYYEDPDGFVPEFTSDVLQIENAQSWQPKEWERIPANANVWNTGGPSPRAIALMSGQPASEPVTQ